MSSASPDTARASVIFAERARRLAERPSHVDNTKRRRVCLCEAGDDLYGLPVEEITRVMPETRAAPLANAGPALMGLISRGGGFALVYDLAALIGDRAPEKDSGHFVLLRSVRPLTALKVARTLMVGDVELLTAEEAVNLPARQNLAAYARASDGRIVSIVDVTTLMRSSARQHSGG